MVKQRMQLWVVLALSIIVSWSLLLLLLGKGPGAQFLLFSAVLFVGSVMVVRAAHLPNIDAFVVAVAGITVIVHAIISFFFPFPGNQTEKH